MPHALSPEVEFVPSSYPPFPSSPSNEFPTVPLETISLRKILANDQTEQERVFEICKNRGFFYLELAGCELGEIIKDGADEVAKVAETAFKLPVDEKLQYIVKGKDLFG